MSATEDSTEQLSEGIVQAQKTTRALEITRDENRHAERPSQQRRAPGQRWRRFGRRVNYGAVSGAWRRGSSRRERADTTPPTMNERSISLGLERKVRSVSTCQKEAISCDLV